MFNLFLIVLRLMFMILLTFKSEFKLILTSINLWWYGAVFLCSMGVFFGKGEVLYKFLIPALWILPIFLWSKLGIIPIKFNMEEYLLVYRNYRRGQVFASFAAAIVFTILVNTALIIKFAMLSNFLVIVQLLIGAVFVNGLGMFIGNLSKSSTAFEITYIILWYVGILNGLPQLDFLGINEKSLNLHLSLIFLILGIGSVMVSAVIKSNRR